MLAAANSDSLGWEVPVGTSHTLKSFFGVRGFCFLSTATAGAATATAGTATFFLNDGTDAEENDHSHDQQYDDISTGHGFHLLSNSA